MIEINKFKMQVGKEEWVMVALSSAEALLLAESLIRQVRSGDPNTARPEFVAQFGDVTGSRKPERVRFSVFVDQTTTPDTSDQR